MTGVGILSYDQVRSAVTPLRGLAGDRMAAKEAFHSRRYLWPVSHRQGMVSIGHLHVLGLGNPCR